MRTTILLCAGLLSASACGDERVAFGTQFPDETTDEGPELGPEAETDSGDSELTPLDQGTDPSDPEPDPGRVFTAFPDGDDDIFLATVGDAVLGHYPDAGHWAIRITPEGTSIALLLDMDGRKLDLVRTRPEASVFFPGQPDARQLCFPDLNSIIGPICVTEPCDWDDSTPGGELPDCFEMSRGADGTHVDLMGAIDGQVVGRIVTEDGVSDVIQADLGETQLARIAQVEDLLLDLQAIVPDMQPLGPSCLDCWWKEFAFSLTAAGCVTSYLGCLPALGQLADVLECQGVEC